MVINTPTPVFPFFHYILGANLGSLLHGDVSVMLFFFFFFFNKNKEFLKLLEKYMTLEEQFTCILIFLVFRLFPYHHHPCQDTKKPFVNGWNQLAACKPCVFHTFAYSDVLCSILQVIKLLLKH